MPGKRISDQAENPIGEVKDEDDELETPDADQRTDESRERLHEPGSSEMRQVTAEDVAHDTQEGSEDRGDDHDRDDERDPDDEDDDEADQRTG